MSEELYGIDSLSDEESDPRRPIRVGRGFLWVSGRYPFRKVTDLEVKGGSVIGIGLSLSCRSYGENGEKSTRIFGLQNLH